MRDSAEDFDARQEIEAPVEPTPVGHRINVPADEKGAAFTIGYDQVSDRMPLWDNAIKICDTRIIRGMTVPEVLLSGNHEDIAAWRMAQRRRKTDERRKDMFEQS